MHHLPSSSLNNLPQDAVVCAPKGDDARYILLLIELPGEGKGTALRGGVAADDALSKPPLAVRLAVGDNPEARLLAWNLAASPPQFDERETGDEDDPVSPVLHAAKGALSSLHAQQSPLSLSRVWAAVLPAARQTLTGKGPEILPHSVGRIVELAIEYIEQNFHRRIRMKDVAKLAGVSVQHFCRVFGKQTGQPFIKFLSGMRAIHAAKLLSNTRKSIKEIAYESGFGSIAQFNRLFRRYFNQKPRDYRLSAGDAQNSPDFNDTELS